LTIEYEKRDGVAYITLANPSKANILDKPTSDAISEAWIDLWEDRSTRCAGTSPRIARGGGQLWIAAPPALWHGPRRCNDPETLIPPPKSTAPAMSARTMSA